MIILFQKLDREFKREFRTVQEALDYKNENKLIYHDILVISNDVHPNPCKVTEIKLKIKSYLLERIELYTKDTVVRTDVNYLGDYNNIRNWIYNAGYSQYEDRIFGRGEMTILAKKDDNIYSFIVKPDKWELDV